MDGGRAAFELGHRRGLDGLRGAAVLAVLVGHIGIPRVERTATVGVSVFFVLSGFLITRLLLEERARTGVDLRRFYGRRALRLFPAMYVMLLVVGLWSLVDPAIDAPVWYPALYVANFALVAGRDLGVFGPLWSLSMEEQFYLVWPIVLLWALRRGRQVLVGVIVAGLAASLATACALTLAQGAHGDWLRVSFGPIARGYALLLGCLMATVADRLALGSRRLVVIVASIAVLAAASLARDRTATFFLVLLPLATVAAGAVVVDLLDDGGVLARPMSARPIRYLGRISYGTYLWHRPIYTAIRAHAGSVPFLLRAPVMVAAAIGVAALSYRYLERPFLRQKDRLRPRPAAAGGGQR